MDRVPYLRPVRVAYAVVFAGSAFALMLDGAQALEALRRSFGLPATASAILGGALNLGWSEAGYVLGLKLSSLTVFAVLPWLGAAAGLVSAALALVADRWGRRMACAALAFGLGVALVYAAASGRGWLADPWRMVNALSWIAADLSWIALLRREVRVKLAPTVLGMPQRRTA